MQRLAIALVLACLVAPAASADDADAWWAESAPQAEPDYGWWHAGGGDVALEGAPEEAPPGLASAAYPVARQSVPSFAVAKTGPACDADTGECDEAPIADETGSGDEGDGAAAPAAGEDDAGEGEDAGSAAASDDPAAAPAEERDEPPHSCNRYAKQITRYQADLAYAKARDNELAARALEAQIGRLTAQMDRRCPLPEPPNQFAATLRTLKKLGKLALTAAKYGLL